MCQLLQLGRNKLDRIDFYWSSYIQEYSTLTALLGVDPRCIGEKESLYAP